MYRKTGKQPTKLKLAHALPIFKKGSRLLVSNYRPISLLSDLNKILEKLCTSVYMLFWKNMNFFTVSNLASGLNILPHMLSSI